MVIRENATNRSRMRAIRPITENKTVHWYKRCKVRFDDSPANEQAEQQNKWYNAGEIECFRQEYRFIIKLIHRLGLKSVENTGGVCCHGMEQKQFKTRRRQAAWCAVLEEQRYQKTAGTNRPEIIAAIYHDISADSRMDAHTCALSWCTGHTTSTKEVPSLLLLSSCIASMPHDEARSQFVVTKNPSARVMLY
jgi:hypothetical protein